MAGRPRRRRRPPFRTQKAGSILLYAAQAALFPEPRVVARSGSTAAAESTAADGAAPASASDASRSAAPLYASFAVLVLVIAVSIGVVIHVLSPASSRPAGSGSTSVPGSAGATSRPAISSLVPSAGQPLPAVRTLDRAHGGASFLQPQESVVGRDGTIYVADTGNHRIAALSRSGRVVRTITAGAHGSLLAPFSLALTPKGQLLVLDSDAGRIIQYDRNGVAVGSSGPSLSLTHARGIAVDPATGDVLIANTPGNTVQTLSPSLALLHEQPNQAGGVELFDQPSAVAVGKDGTIDVLDSQNNRVVQFDQGWHVLHTWPIVGSDTLHSPRLLPLSGGRVLATDPADGKLLLYSPGVPQPVAYALPAAGSALAPLGLTATRSGTVLVTCNNANQLLEVRVPGI